MDVDKGPCQKERHVLERLLAANKCFNYKYDLLLNTISLRLHCVKIEIIRGGKRLKILIVNNFLQLQINL